MKGDATEWAWAQKDLTPTDRLVLLALARGAKGIFVRVVAKELMALTEMSEVDVVEAVHTLRDANLIRRMEVDGETVSYLTMPKPPKARGKREANTALAPAADLEAAVAAYNEMAKRCHLARVTKVTETLKRSLSARLAEGGLATWAQALQAIEVSAHCRGLNDRGWKASFAFMLQPSSYGKLINGTYGTDYQEKSNGGQRTSLAGRGDERADRLRGFIQRNGGSAPSEQDFGRGDRDDHQDAGADGRGAQRRLSGPAPG